MSAVDAEQVKQQLEMKDTEVERLEDQVHAVADCKPKSAGCSSRPVVCSTSSWYHDTMRRSQR
jgi:hypothetical protein